MRVLIIILTEMKNNKHKRSSIDALVDKNKLKDFGITKDRNDDDMEAIDGDEVNGGRENEKANTTAVCGHWPTNAS